MDVARGTVTSPSVAATIYRGPAIQLTDVANAIANVPRGDPLADSDAEPISAVKPQPSVDVTPPTPRAVQTISASSNSSARVANVEVSHRVPDCVLLRPEVDVQPTPKRSRLARTVSSRPRAIIISPDDTLRSLLCSAMTGQEFEVEATTWRYDVVDTSLDDATADRLEADARAGRVDALIACGSFLTFRSLFRDTTGPGMYGVKNLTATQKALIRQESLAVVRLARLIDLMNAVGGFVFVQISAGTGSTDWTELDEI